MAKNKNNPQEEIIPEGMSKKQYADKAFRRKITIINICLLSVGVIAILSVLVMTWYNTKIHNDEFDKKAAAFKAETESVILQLEQIEKDGGSHEDKSKVKINVTDDTFYDWINTLDDSYQGDREAENYAEFGGAEIHLQGMFYTKEFDNGVVQYWVYRNHSHEGHEHNDEHDHEEVAEGEEFSTADMVPIEVIFDEEVEIPKDGTWVDVTGIVGPDSTKNLSAIRYAKIKLMDEPGQEYVE